MDGLKISQLAPGAPLQNADKFPVAREGENYSITAAEIVAKMLEEFDNKAITDLFSVNETGALLFNGNPVNAGSFPVMEQINASRVLTAADLGKIYIVNPSTANIIVTLPRLTGDLLNKSGLNTVFIRTVKNDYSVQVKPSGSNTINSLNWVYLDFPGDCIATTVAAFSPASYVLQYSRGFDRSIIRVSTQAELVKAMNRFKDFGPGYIFLQNSITLTSNLTLQGTSVFIMGTGANRPSLNLSTFRIITQSPDTTFADLIINGNKADINGDTQRMLTVSIMSDVAHRVNFMNLGFTNILGETDNAKGFIEYTSGYGPPPVPLKALTLHFDNCYAYTPGDPGTDSAGMHIKISLQTAALNVTAFRITRQDMLFNKIFHESVNTALTTIIHDGTASVDSAEWDDAVNIAADAAGTGDITLTVLNAATLKETPADADKFTYIDTQNGNILKFLTWANIKARLKAYFDTIYSTFNGTWASLSGKPATFAPATHNNTAHSEQYLTQADLNNLQVIAEGPVQVFSLNEVNVSLDVQNYHADCNANHVGFILPTAAQFAGITFHFRHIRGTYAMTVYRSNTALIMFNNTPATEITTDVPGTWLSLKYDGTNYHVCADSGLTLANIVEPS